MEETKTSKELAETRRDENGRLLPGQRSINPEGRPKGSVNKFTQVKQDIVDLWGEEDGKEMLRAELLKKRNTLKIIKDVIIPILPKEPLIDQSVNVTNVSYEWNTQEDQD